MVVFLIELYPCLISTFDIMILDFQYDSNSMKIHAILILERCCLFENKVKDDYFWYDFELLHHHQY